MIMQSGVPGATDRAPQHTRRSSTTVLEILQLFHSPKLAQGRRSETLLGLAVTRPGRHDC
jgi:hypothetical protein